MSGDKIIIICGKRWSDVTDTTTAGKVYPLEDVIACNGKEPDYVSNK